MNSPAYYSHLRPDVLAAVPAEASTVLSVGCGAGVTEEQLVARGCTVAGIELDSEAAAQARTRGLIICEGDATQVDVARFGLAFDFIIYADVLEHLPDPEQVLRRHLAFLRPGGTLYISVPNFRHYTVFWQLFFHGEVIYVDAGVLDRTHLRMTTRKMVLRWLRSCDLVPLRVRYSIYARRFRLLSWATAGLFREFLAHQIGVLATRRT